MITAELTLVGQYNPIVAASMVESETVGVLRAYNTDPYSSTKATATIAQSFGIESGNLHDLRVLRVIHIVLVYEVDERFFAEAHDILWGKLSFLYHSSLYKGHLKFAAPTETP